MTSTTLPRGDLRSPAPGAGPERSWWWDSAYLLAAFPLAVTSFSVLVTGVAASAGLLVTLLGVPLGVLTLLAARWFAVAQRWGLRAAGHDAPEPPYAPLRLGTLRGWVEPLREGQLWRDLLHGLVSSPLATVTWSVLVTWWAGALGGLTYPLWVWAVPQDGETLFELLGLPTALEQVAYVLLGALFAVSLPVVSRGLATAHAALGRTLLTGQGAAELQRRLRQVSASRDSAVQAEASAMRRLERDLHDGPQQRLVRLTMDLSAAQRRLESDPETAKPLVAEALAQTREALGELRALSRGIAPPILTDRGLPAALAAVASRCTVPVDLDVRLAEGERLPAHVESGAYFVVTEALTNVAKHSGATAARVRVDRSGGWLRIVVEDDGHGGAHAAKGHGLAGLVERTAALEGGLDVDSPPGGPTVLRAVLPCG
ncbi:sensor histidine kinase [Vallicoccus soli]|uniref:histidine kinase n=1 Tax=Vallicoccus soli TaxID=2339232 RepID=A0A3A3YYX7_9ACTN|nr:sensor histidine kinase [Vallicoccus soli]RJK94348.1 sensor histidine kinase [Vallicoccus soli]